MFETYLRRTIVHLHASRLRRLRLERAYLTREARRAELCTMTPHGTDLQEIDGASPAGGVTRRLDDFPRSGDGVSVVDRSRGAQRGSAVPRRRGQYRPSWSLGRSIPLMLTMLLVATGCETERTEGSDPSRSPPPRYDEILRLLEEHAEEHNAGVIALVETDGRVWRGGAGLDQHDRPVDPGARFDIGSTAKTFEATVALQLVEEGRLSLDDRVEEWIPDRVQGARRVLIRHLLNHTSGLTGPRAPFHPITTPGMVFSYSNLGYGLLDEILSEVTGRPSGREIRHRIIEPLGLEETWTSPEDSSLPWLGAPYGVCRFCVPPEGRGGPISTTSDLARFFQALLRGDLLGADMLAEMTETVPMSTELSAGLGLFRFDLPCGTAYGYGGDLTYYTNQVLVSGDGSKAVVIARNSRDWFSLKALAEEIYCLSL